MAILPIWAAAVQELHTTEQKKVVEGKREKETFARKPQHSKKLVYKLYIKFLIGLACYIIYVKHKLSIILHRYLKSSLGRPWIEADQRQRRTMNTTLAGKHWLDWHWLLAYTTIALFYAEYNQLWTQAAQSLTDECDWLWFWFLSWSGMGLCATTRWEIKSNYCCVV